MKLTRTLERQVTTVVTTATMPTIVTTAITSTFSQWA